MTDPAIIAASYAAEKNYSHNPDDVIDPSGAVLAIGTEKVDTTTLKDRSPEDNNATIHGPMPTEGFIQGRRFTAANGDYLDCGNGASNLNLSTGDFTICAIVKTIDNRGPVIGKGYYDAALTHGYGIGTINSKYIFQATDGSASILNSNVSVSNDIKCIRCVRSSTTRYIYINGVLANSDNNGGLNVDSIDSMLLGYTTYAEQYSDSIIYFASVENIQSSETENEQFFNTLARLPFWSVNYTDYPDNVAEYTDNLPYSSSIISSGTFKVDDDKLQGVSAGTVTYSASYDFDGSEYIKVKIDGIEYAGTGTITQGNTTVSVAQGSNKVTIVMGTGDTIEGEIGIQFREEV